MASVNEAHSDDELAEGTGESDTVYHIKEKEGRSAKVTAFFRMADKERQRMNKGKSRHYKLTNVLFLFYISLTYFL